MLFVRYIGLALVTDDDESEEDEDEVDEVEVSHTSRERQDSIPAHLSSPLRTSNSLVVATDRSSDFNGRGRVSIRSDRSNEVQSERVTDSGRRASPGRISSERSGRGYESAERGSSGERSASQRDGEPRRRIKRSHRSPPSSLM